ncbi:MAG: PorT family protein [Bacteroidaceae bacterium]|nr:PorT family protein [Bacteroidaceae bacterium]
MKKVIFSAILMMVSVVAVAQQRAGSLSIVPKVGLTLATVTDDDCATKGGLIAGAEAMYQLTDNIGLSGGLFYAMQGYNSDNEGIKGELDSRYINVPILVNAYVAKGFAVKAGIQAGFLLSAEAGIRGGGANVMMDVKDMCNNADLSIPLGASYEFNRFVVDARYNLGINNVLKEDGGDGNGKNGVFQFTVGYKF